MIAKNGEWLTASKINNLNNWLIIIIIAGQQQPVHGYTNNMLNIIQQPVSNLLRLISMVNDDG